MNCKIMKLLNIIILAGLLTGPAHATVSVIRSPYQPQKIYAGPFPVNAIYYRNPGNPMWKRAFQRELQGLTCRPAIAGFTLTGTWQGHLNPDGTCADPAEPVDWAVGNRLNYEGVTLGTAR